jgi:tetratricopeptide (TPR) repeat protein
MVQRSPFADPRFLKALRGLEEAVALQRSGRTAEADAAFARVVKKNPHYFDALHLYGLFKYRQGKTAEALNLVAKAVKVNPRSAEHRFAASL